MSQPLQVQAPQQPEELLRVTLLTANDERAHRQSLLRQLRDATNVLEVTHARYIALEERASQLPQTSHGRQDPVRLFDRYIVGVWLMPPRAFRMRALSMKRAGRRKNLRVAHESSK